MKKILQLLLTYFLFVPCLCFGQDAYDFYISNKGNDGYPGVLKQLPKRTIAATSPFLENYSQSNGQVKVGLKSGDVFDESLVPTYPIHVGIYTDSAVNPDFAILNGSKEFANGWSRETPTAHTYKQDITYSGFQGYGINNIGTYSYIYVIAVDKTTEKTAPFSSRKPLKFVKSLAAVDTIPGSFYAPVNTNENPMPVYLHPVDGTSPNDNSRYRYEVTVRDWAINSANQPDNVFENLWVRGFGAGNGMLPGGHNSKYNKVIFGPGAGIHHAVVRSGVIDHSLFLPGPKNTNDFAVVFYDGEGLGRRGTVRNSMFLDIGSPLYTHTSYGSNYGMIEMDNVVAFADLSEARGFMFTKNNDSVALNNIYADGYLCGYNYGTAAYASIKNSFFKDVKFGLGYSPIRPVNATVENVFIKTKGSVYTAGIYMQDNTSLSMANSIIHIRNNYSSYLADAGAFVYGTGRGTGKIVATGNIFICDIHPAATLMAATTNTDNGVATSDDIWNNNVYVLLRGNKIAWRTTNASTNSGSNILRNLDEWKAQSGQDGTSLFFDLRNDPRGLKAIFADPENGNYDLANTAEGRQIAALRAGMASPPTCFLRKPSHEEAADLVRQNKVLSVNTCRNPCQQNRVRISNTFDASATNSRQVNVTWKISEQQNIDHYDLQRATGNTVFKKVQNFPVRTDSVYSHLDDAPAGVAHQYRLAIFPVAGGICYSDIKTVKINDNKAFTIYPNPTAGKLFISMNGYVGTANVRISNSSGQVITENKILNLYRASSIDLSNVPKGVYFLKVETSTGSSVQKLLVQ